MHIWADRYDRDLSDILPVQDDITLTLATEMQVKSWLRTQFRVDN